MTGYSIQKLKRVKLFLIKVDGSKKLIKNLSTVNHQTNASKSTTIINISPQENLNHVFNQEMIHKCTHYGWWTKTRVKLN